MQRFIKEASCFCGGGIAPPVGKVSCLLPGSGNVSLKFGDDDSDMYDDMVDVGAFLNAASEKIFENVNSGMLA